MRKSSFPAGQVHPDWRESAAFSPIYLRTGVSAAVAATWRPSAAASFYTSWHRPCGASRGYFAQKGRLNALRAAFLARLSAREAFRFSGTCLRAQPQPFLRRSSHGLYFASQSCIALPCRRQLFLDLYLFFLVRLFYVCGRRTYLASNASSSVPSSSFSIRSGASRKRLVKR